MEAPIYKADAILEIEGVESIALVENPAMLTQWLMFSEQKETLHFALDNDMQIITAPVIIADLPIERLDKQNKKYFVVYSANDVLTLAQKFGSENKNRNIKITHQTNELTSDAFIFESFVSDSKRGISQPKGFDLPNGTWFVSLKVTSPELWQRVKSGEFKGISLEGLFNLEMIETLDEREIEAVINAVIK